MDVFDLRQRLVEDYADFTRSFVKGGLLWPDPIVQLNPAFEPGGTVDELVDAASASLAVSEPRSVVAAAGVLINVASVI